MNQIETRPRTRRKACSDCLRRSRLLAHLAPYIARAATGAPGSRISEEAGG